MILVCGISSLGKELEENIVYIVTGKNWQTFAMVSSLGVLCPDINNGA